jgi:hypothetical protein
LCCVARGHIRAASGQCPEFVPTSLYLSFLAETIAEVADLPLDLTSTKSQSNKPAIPAKTLKKWKHLSLLGGLLKSSKSSVEDELFNLDTPFWFPNKVEKARIRSVTVKTTSEIRSQLSVPTPVGPIGVSGVGSTKESTGMKDEFIFRFGVREYNAEKLVKLRWLVSFQVVYIVYIVDKSTYVPKGLRII